MKTHFSILFLFVTALFTLDAQESDKQFQSELAKKGIVIIDDKNTVLIQSEKDLILNYNFDLIRNELSSRKIQILNGPLLLVQSFEYLKKNQMSFDKVLADSKSGEIINDNEIQLVTLLNVGIGVKTVETLH